MADRRISDFHMLNKIRSILSRLLKVNELPLLNHAVIELNDCDELRKLFGWHDLPILDDASIYDFEYPEDLNSRRVRDAEVLGTVMRNSFPRRCLEIGTSTGHSAALMAINAPEAQIFTVNIPPEEIARGEGGEFTTVALDREKIGAYYRERRLGNVTQILVNTARWEPDIGEIDVTFIDGSHDADFVYNDSRKILKHMKTGSFILWHDFNLELAAKYPWIHSVCSGVEKLIQTDLIKGRIFHLRDSWTGVYRV